jgi:lambda repressor-like predicted transcriptional regulator
MFHFEPKLTTEMHPEQIKAEIRMKGATPSSLADGMDRSRMLISNVIHGRVVSRPVAKHISAFLGKSLNDLWPGKYGKEGHAKPSPLRRASNQSNPSNTKRKP